MRNTGGDLTTWATGLVLALAAACSSSPEASDAPASDARPDAGVDGEVPTTAHVVTYSRDGRLRPVPGTFVWSNRADGSVHEQAQTDALGEATIHVEPGGAVTALYGSLWLESILEVEPGDVLQFGRITGNFAPVIGSVTVTWPLYPGANSYMVTNGLYGEVQDFNETSGTLLFSDEVPNPIDLVVHAYDGSGVLIAVAHQLNTTIVDGATYALTEWRPVGSWSVVVENFPPSMVVADGSSNFFTPNTPQWPLGGTQTNSGEDISAEHRLHVPGFASDLSTTMSVYGTAYDGQQDPPHYIVYCYEETLPPPGEVTVQLEAPSVIGNPTFDPATRTGTWTRLTAGTDDFVLFQVFTAAGPGGLVWRVRAPGSSTEVSFPSVPVDRPDLPTGPVGLDVWVSNERAATSYDELRALPQWELGLEAPYSSNYAASGASIPPP